MADVKSFYKVAEDKMDGVLLHLDDSFPLVQCSFPIQMKLADNLHTKIDIRTIPFHPLPKYQEHSSENLHDSAKDSGVGYVHPPIFLLIPSFEPKRQENH